VDDGHLGEPVGPDSRPGGMHIARFLVSAFLLTACAADAGAQLDSREFVSTSVTEAGVERPLVPGTEIRVSFRDGQLGASAGCNTIGGAYRLEGGRLAFDGGGMTEMGCDDERHEQDDWLVAFLGADPSVVLSGSDLALTSGDVVIELTDREVAQPDLELVGPTWQLESIISGDAVASMEGIEDATFEFGDDGTVTFNTACNEGAGRYEVDGDRLRFVDVVVTERACDGPAGEIEEAVLPLLGADPMTFAIDADSLTLMSGDRGLVLRGS
jgi:heat shock protein HslJ